MELERLAVQYNLYREISDSQLKNPTPTSVSNSPSTNNDEAVVSHIEDSAFSQKLFKHISDYYAGEGNLSKETNRQLAIKDSKIANSLNSDDPNASALYSSYRTAGFSYGSKARFITGVESSVKLSSDIRRIYSTKA